MTDVPRKLPKSRSKRLENIVSSYLPGSGMGMSEYSAPVGDLKQADKDEYPRISFCPVAPENARVGDFYVDPADLE